MNSTFRTTDVDLAAFIHTVAEKCQGVEKVVARHLGEFQFERTEKVEEALALWESGLDSVSAQAYARNRTLLYRWARSVVDASR